MTLTLYNQHLIYEITLDGITIKDIVQRSWESPAPKHIKFGDLPELVQDALLDHLQKEQDA